MIYICCLAEMPIHVERLRPSHLVSLVAPEELPPTPAAIIASRHLAMGLHDIVEPLDGCIHCEAPHIERLVDFFERWVHDDAPMLIHCYAGISRSMAAALIAAVIKAPGRELEAAQALRKAAPHSQPNRRIVRLADEMLGCEGRLVAAREAMGPGVIVERGPLTRLPLLD